MEDPDQFEESGYTKEDLDILEKMSKEARQEITNAIYDSMSSAKMTATMDTIYKKTLNAS